VAGVVAVGQAVPARAISRAGQTKAPDRVAVAVFVPAAAANCAAAVTELDTLHGEDRAELVQRDEGLAESIVAPVFAPAVLDDPDCPAGAGVAIEATRSLFGYFAFIDDSWSIKEIYSD
jgi:hypothetical protein